MKQSYQRTRQKSEPKFAVVEDRELELHLPLPLVAVLIDGIEIAGQVLLVARNGKRWQGGDHIGRWTAAGLLETEKKFRKVKGYRERKELAGKLNPELPSRVQVA